MGKSVLISPKAVAKRPKSVMNPPETVVSKIGEQSLHDPATSA